MTQVCLSCFPRDDFKTRFPARHGGGVIPVRFRAGWQQHTAQCLIANCDAQKRDYANGAVVEAIHDRHGGQTPDGAASR